VLGCGRAAPEAGDAWRAERLDADTTGVTRGAALLTSFEVFREPGGAVRARGTTSLPDGVRLQLSLIPAGSGLPVARTQFTVRAGRFDSPPLGLGEPLPPGAYTAELLALFDSSWQPAEVLRATDDGRALRGPGMVVGNGRIPALIHREEQRL
jgi:hypothetical protein